MYWLEELPCYEPQCGCNSSTLHGLCCCALLQYAVASAENKFYQHVIMWQQWRITAFFQISRIHLLPVKAAQGESLSSRKGMIYEDSWINSLAFCGHMQVIFFPCQGTHDLGLLCKRQPAAWAKDNGMFKCFGFSLPPPTSAEGEKPGYQHHSRICKHSSLGKIRGL